MLRAVNDLTKYSILATDGPIGQVVDVLMDDRRWAVRYLVVDTGTRQVLISPFSIGQPDWAAQQLPVSLTKQRVEDSPSVDTHTPISRQQELDHSSVLVGQQILATDGDLGHVDNLLVEDQTWAVRYFVVNTSNWWGGHKVLISPQWMSEVNWPESTVSLDLSREQIQSAPPYDAEALFERQHEQAMHEHYGRPTYWAKEP